MEQATEQAAEQQPESTPATPAPEDLAAADYLELLPRFKAKIENLSSHRLKRVATALMEHPFERLQFSFSNVEEAEAFDLGVKIMDRKFVLMKAVFEMNKEEVSKFIESGNAEKEGN